MKFGIYNEIQASPGADYKQRYDEVLRSVELGDALGYDVFMTLEHHFFPTFSISVNPLAFFAAAAQRSKNIRFRAMCHTLPVHNPMVLAAEIAQCDHLTDGRLEAARREVDTVSRRLGRRIKILVGKPGLDGHSNGAEQIAVRARDVGMDVIYAGIRFTPAELVKTAKDEGVDVIGLSILSGSHVPLVRDVVERMRAAGLDDVPVVVGGIVPPEDEATLKKAGVAAVYTPKDFQINQIMSDVVRIVEQASAKTVG